MFVRRRLTAELRGLVAVVQTIIVPVALPALLDTAVVLAGKLPRLALRRRHVGGVGWTQDETQSRSTRETRSERHLQNKAVSE